MLREIILLSLRLGFTAFGGPAAHIAMLHDEVVQRRKWLDDQQFLDLLGATNLIPGPNSTEMVIHVSYLRGGWRGLILGGVSFILPAMLMVMGLAWAYVRFGATPQADWIFYGVKPVIIAIVAQALWVLGRKAVVGWLTAVVACAVLVFYLFGVNELLLLALGGLAVIGARNGRRLFSGGATVLLPLGGFLGLMVTTTAVPFSLSTLFFTFLKIGSVLYGSGYVLFAFLRGDFVERLGWLSDQQLIDAVAVGQLTPGPVFTSATFVGYLMGGVPAALLATLGIFLPSFIFVALSAQLVPRIRRSAWAAALLDGVNAASLGLMAAVTVQLAQTAIMDGLTLFVLAAALLLLLRFRLNTTWLITGGALLGWVARAFT